MKRLPTGPNGGIQLLLIQRVPNLGDHGDIVEVKPGYANNYLIPQGIATIATDHHVRMVEKHKSKLIQLEKAKLKSFHDLKDLIEKLSVTIEANANEEGHLYGSVGAVEIVNSLKQQDFNIAKDQIRMEGVLKELGLYTVQVRLHPEIAADLKVWVVPAVKDEEAEPTA